MPPEVKIERASAVRNFTVIRATPAQTTLLKASYAHSNIASREQLGELSEQTGLPQKWIHQWFGRQRSKDRKGQSSSLPGVVSNRSGSPSAHLPVLRSGSAYSQDSILQTKSESGDPGVFLSSSGTPTGSEYLGTVSVSSSMTIEEPHPSRDFHAAASLGQATKKKRKGAQLPTADVSTSKSTRTLRSRTKKEPVAQGSVIKKELVEEALSFNVSGPHTASNQSAGGSRKVPGAGYSQTKIARSAPRLAVTASVLRHALLPMIAPAKRSPITAPNLHQPTSVIKPPSKLSIDQSDSIYAHSSGVQPQRDEGQTTNTLSQALPWNSGTQKAAAYQYDKPIFHTRFLNNGPSDFAHNNVHRSVISKFDDLPVPRFFDSSGNVAVTETVSAFIPLTEMRRPAPFPLAPAFDWYNPIPSGSNTCDLPSEASSSPIYPEDTKKPLQFRFSKPGPNPVEVALDQVIKELDPSVAPQKHLLDILQAHRDENGIYTLDAHLFSALLGDVGPFYQAMGLSFLSQLGVEWVRHSLD